jgi:membrane associated rhomboid family serine protease
MRVARFHRFEVVAVLVLTAAAWGYDQSLSPMESYMLSDRFGAVPVRMVAAWQSFREQGLTADGLAAALPLVTANFLHAGFMHLAMNMLFFWIFGNALSEAAGRGLFLVLYLLAGMIAVLVHVRTNPTSDAPMIGASGAIAGLEGAYFVLAYRWELPHAHVWPLDGPVAPWRLAVVALVGFFLDASSFFRRVDDSTAYGAHVGGFLGGAILAMMVATVWRPKFRR